MAERVGLTSPSDVEKNSQVCIRSAMILGHTFETFIARGRDTSVILLKLCVDFILQLIATQ